MVFYYTSTAVDPPATIYVGKDKFESKGQHAPRSSSAYLSIYLAHDKTNQRPPFPDEELIKYGWEEDVW